MRKAQGDKTTGMEELGRWTPCNSPSKDEEMDLEQQSKYKANEMSVSVYHWMISVGLRPAG